MQLGIKSLRLLVEIEIHGKEGLEDPLDLVYIWLITSKNAQTMFLEDTNTFISSHLMSSIRNPF